MRFTWYSVKATVIIVVLLFVVLLVSEQASAQYTDINNHWAKHTFEVWLDEGIIEGYDDGTIRPDKQITRAEFVAMINRVFPISTLSTHTFTDTPVNSWYMMDLQRVYSKGIISGYPDGSFRPSDLIAKQEAALIVYRLAGTEIKSSGLSKLLDIDEASPWSRDAIVQLAEAGLINADGYFRPQAQLTRAEAVTMLDQVYTKQEQLHSADIKSLFSESFHDKKLVNRQVLNAESNVIWTINETTNQTHAITKDGALELGGSRYMQRLQLQDAPAVSKKDYAMEFTVNIQRMINQGDSERPMAVIIPRTKDSNYNQYYAVTYYMETTPMGAIVANLFKIRWAIVNTAAPSGMQPLAEGYFLLKEDVDYKAQLTIENTDAGVHIAFYLDGPTDPQTEHEPVVAYTDQSPYRILESAAGPAFGMVGEANDSWGHPPLVQFDDIRIYDLKEYSKWHQWLNRYAHTPIKDMDNHPLYNEMKYLVNRGLMEVKTGNKAYPEQGMTEAEFVQILANWSGEPSLHSNSNLALTKEIAANWVYTWNGNPTTNGRYKALLTSASDRTVSDAVHYTFENGILGLESNHLFAPKHELTRGEVALLLMRIIDPGYRLPHGQIKLPSVIQSHAVLQRDKPIEIWGTGTSGESIEVTFKQQTKTTMVVNGQWSITLDPEPYGGPHTLTVSGISEKIELTDILVGDVFIVAGQSNVEMSMAEVNESEEVMNRFKDDPNFRFYFTKSIMSTSPRFDDEGYWTIPYSWALSYSSALGTFFVDKLKELNSDLADVPIGVIRMTYGGSTIELFLPDSLLKEQNYIQQHDEPIMSGYWNGYMETIVPYSAKAVLYYQGENSTQLGYSYEPLLRAYLRTLREEFKDPNLPIFLVQLTGYGDNYYSTDIDSWPIIREIQMRVANTTPNTELVSAVDLSDPNPLEIHPKDKRAIGERLAYSAMETIYEAGKQRKSAAMESVQLALGRYSIVFKDVNDKLVLNDVDNTGFEILNEQGSWIPAKARITGKQTVEVWHADISNPIGVRYAWRNYPSVALFDALGLPVLPFNSTKDLYSNAPAVGTNEHHIRIMNHFLDSYDAIVNLTHNQKFRMIEVVDGHLLWHEYAIEEQAAGDEIAKFTRLPNRLSEQGTTDTLINMRNHGLKKDDWVRNNSKAWTDSRVIRIIDEHTFEIEMAVSGQAEGDDLELYSFSGISIAMGSFE